MCWCCQNATTLCWLMIEFQAGHHKLCNAIRQFLSWLIGQFFYDLLDHLNFTFQNCFYSANVSTFNLDFYATVFSRDRQYINWQYLHWNKNATSEMISSHCAEVVRSCIIYLQHTLALLQFTGCSASHGSMHPSGWVIWWARGRPGLGCWNI